MRVLWVCNIMLPAYAAEKGIPSSSREGWLTGCYERVTRDPEDKRSFTLGVAFPASGEIPEDTPAKAERIGGVSFYRFAENLNAPEAYDPALETRFQKILEDFKPDILHIFGSEFPHALAAAKAFGKPEQTLLGIQGLCGCIAEQYMAGLPESVQQETTFRDRLKDDSLLQQQDKYRIRGEREAELIRMVNHVTGRTQFDRTETDRIHPGICYHEMNETMRPAFYSGCWQRSKAEPYSIFLSQGDYPLKGFHTMLQAMPELIRKHPEAHLYVAGNSIIGHPDRRTVKVADDPGTQIRGSRYPLFLRISAYGRYLKHLISEHHLKKHVTVLGKLSAEQMKEQYLRCSVFVCPSWIENSPNCIGEAMLIGAPVVASRTGGIPSLLEENVDGLLFETGNLRELTDSILQIWEEKVITSVYSNNERAHARRTHNADANYNRLLEIYHELEPDNTTA